jgi:hypothetical protein
MSSIVEASPSVNGVRDKSRREAKPVEIALFIVAVGLWVVFALVLLLSQQSIDQVWAWFKDQTLLLQVPVGIMFLPWVIGMWIWESSWPFAARGLLVGGIAWANLYSFFPSKAS